MNAKPIKILRQGPGFTIARSFIPGALVPYNAVDHNDGYRNHGYIDLRGSPELVYKIPEARKSTGLSAILKVIAHPKSALMTCGCECYLFDCGEGDDQPRFLAGGYISVMFKSAEKNRNIKAIQDIAAYILNGISGAPQHHIVYEMILEPLKLFFGDSDCFALMLKPLGFGDTKEQAWASFEHASNSIAVSLCRDSGGEIALDEDSF